MAETAEEKVVGLTKENIDEMFKGENDFPQMNPSDLTDKTDPLKADSPTGDLGNLKQEPAKTEPAATDPLKETPKSTGTEQSLPQLEYLKNLAAKYELTDGLDEFTKDVTADNVDDKLVEFISRNIDYDGFLEKRIHPNLLNIQKALDSGKKWEEVSEELVKQNVFLNDNEKVVAAVLKDEYGFDDTKITAHINTYKEKGMLELEADKARSYLNKQQQFQEAKKLEIQNENIQKQTQRIQKEVEEATQYFNGLNDVAGLTLSKADKEEFSQIFKHAATPGKDGKIPIAEWLQSNENLAKVVYLVTRGDAKFKKQLTDAKELVKTNLEKKLYPEAPKRNESYNNKTPQEEILDVFAAD